MNKVKKKSNIPNTRQLLFYPKQCYSCISCGKCCSVWDVPVTHSEKQFVESLNIPGIDFSQNSYFNYDKKTRLFRINKNNERCVFLDDDNLCLIHKHHGEPSKPLACRLYPFDFQRWDDNKTSISFRSDCPAVATSTGKLIEEYLPEFSRFITELKSRQKAISVKYNSELQPTMKQIHHITDAYKKIFEDDKLPPRTKFYGALRLLLYHEDKEHSGDIVLADHSYKNDAFNFIMRSKDSLDQIIQQAKPLNANQRCVFRYILTGYARIDEEAREGIFILGRLQRTYAVTKFIIGKGNLHDLGERYPDTSKINIFKILNEADFSKDTLIPYMNFFLTKLYTLGFYGVSNQQFGFQHGMKHLLLTFPMTCTFAAMYAHVAGRRTIQTEDISKAVMIVAHTFSHSPFFKLNHIKKITIDLCSADNYASLIKHILIN